MNDTEHTDDARSTHCNLCGANLQNGEHVKRQCPWYEDNRYGDRVVARYPPGHKLSGLAMTFCGDCGREMEFIGKGIYQCKACPELTAQPLSREEAMNKARREYFGANADAGWPEQHHFDAGFTAGYQSRTVAAADEKPKGCICDHDIIHNSECSAHGRTI